MSPIFQSGAFIQQCFSVHPLCLSLHKFAPPDLVVLTCTSCRMTHRMTVRAMTTRLPVALASAEVSGSDARGRDHLAQCASSHPLALGVRVLDIARDSVGLRCAECRRFYDLDVATFETQQR